MLTLFVVLIPLLVAVGCILLALKLPEKGTEQDHAMRLLGGAFAIGLLFSGITWWQQTTVDDQLARARQASASQKADAAWDNAQDKDREGKIKALTDQVNSLKAQLAQQPQTAQPSMAAGATKTQSVDLPKLYWTQQDIGSGQTAVQFKTYGQLNIPAFVAICDRPCQAIHGSIGTTSEGTPVEGTTSMIAGYVFRKPRPIPAGTDGAIIIRPAAAKVMQFKILGETEIPESLR